MDSVRASRKAVYVILDILSPKVRSIILFGLSITQLRKSSVEYNSDVE